MGSWKVSYASTRDSDQGLASFLDGELHLWKNSWVVIMDYYGQSIEGRYLKSDEVIKVGSAISLPHYHVRILKGIISPPEVRVTNPSLNRPPSPTALHLNLRKWKITYSTLKDLDHGRMKAYDGSLEFLMKANKLILKNAKGT
jgi:hypothetical protein